VSEQSAPAALAVPSRTWARITRRLLGRMHFLKSQRNLAICNRHREFAQFTRVHPLPLRYTQGERFAFRPTRMKDVERYAEMCIGVS
jgi:hypothetical protein